MIWGYVQQTRYYAGGRSESDMPVRNQLAVAFEENEALKEVAKELSKEQWKQFLRGVGG